MTSIHTSVSPERLQFQEGKQFRGGLHITLSDSYSIESQQLLKLKLNAQFHPTQSQIPIAEELKDSQVLLMRSRTVVDARLLEMAPQLKVVGTATSGLNHIDLKLCQQKGIRVVNAREANTQSTSEHTLLLILNLLRKLSDAQKSVRSGDWRSSLTRGSELHGKLVGIIGLGRIGTRVAQLVQAFGAQTMAYDPYVDHKHFARNHVKPVGFTELLKQCEILTLHIPLTGETKNMLNRQSLSLLNESCLLVNTSRGGVLNENDLTQFLVHRRLAGAALDVCNKEPLPPGSPWLNTPNLLLSPHLGAFTKEAFTRASMDVAQQVVDFFVTCQGG